MVTGILIDMNRLKSTLIGLLIFLCFGLFFNAAGTAAFQEGGRQAGNQTSYPTATLRRDFKNSYPINAGEKLEFEVRFSRFPIYATVGVITFQFLGPVDLKSASENIANPGPIVPVIPGLNIDYRPPVNEPLLKLRASAVSKGILIAILGIDVKDRFESIVDGNDFSALLNFQDLKEGKSHTVQSAVFDREAGKVKYQTNDLNKPDAPPRIKSLPLEQGMMSLLSAFYFVRFQKYKEGQMIQFPVSGYEENYIFDILVHKREKINTDCGKIKAVKLEPKLFGPGKLFNRKGEMFFWLSDDKKHTPLRMIAKTPQGTVTAKLMNYKNNCQIIDPEAPEAEENQKKNSDNKQPGK